MFLTGGMSQILNLEDRIRREFRLIAPYGQDFSVLKASNAVLDGWRGACMFANSETFQSTCVTRSDYLEFGHDYLKEHKYGNMYYESQK